MHWIHLGRVMAETKKGKVLRAKPDECLWDRMELPGSPSQREPSQIPFYPRISNPSDYDSLLEY